MFLQILTCLCIATSSFARYATAATAVQNSDITTVKCRPGYHPTSHRRSGIITVKCVRNTPISAPVKTPIKKRAIAQKPVRPQVIHKYIPVPINSQLVPEVQTNPPPITRMEPIRRKFIAPFSRELGNFDGFYLGVSGNAWLNKVKLNGSESMQSGSANGMSPSTEKIYHNDNFSGAINLGGSLYVSENSNLLVGLDVEIPIPKLTTLQFDQFNATSNISSFTIKPLVIASVRVGFPITESVLPYIKVGAILSHIDLQPQNTKSVMISNADPQAIGYQFAAGIDFAMSPNMHFRCEYSIIHHRDHKTSLTLRTVAISGPATEQQAGELAYNISSQVLKLSILYYF